jgi:hypothetical protein
VSRVFDVALVCVFRQQGETPGWCHPAVTDRQVALRRGPALLRYALSLSGCPERRSSICPILFPAAVQLNGRSSKPQVAASAFDLSKVNLEDGSSINKRKIPRKMRLNRFNTRNRKTEFLS